MMGSSETLVLIVFVILLGAISIGLISYIAYKRISSARRIKLEKFLSKFTDISNINHIIVIDSKSGIDIFSQSFGERILNPSLKSEFLKAISSFGSQILEASRSSQTVNIKYKESIIMLTEFINLRIIALLKENPSPDFKFIMEDLAYDIYKYYGEEIDKFRGILKPFQGIKDLIEKHLNVSIFSPKDPFLQPLKLVENPNIILNSAEKEMVNMAKKYMKENNFNYFYSLYLLPSNAATPKDYQTIFKLIDKGVFQPFSPNQKDKSSFKSFSDSQKMKKDFYSYYFMPKKEFSPKDDKSTFRFDDDDRDRFPFPYIFTHPRPPDDFEGASQVQLRKPQKDRDSEEEVNCQYCGMNLSREQLYNHSCKKNTE